MFGFVDHWSVDLYRKSHKRECNSGFMGTNDALKKIKISRAVERWWIEITQATIKGISKSFYSCLSDLYPKSLSVESRRLAGRAAATFFWNDYIHQLANLHSTRSSVIVKTLEDRTDLGKESGVRVLQTPLLTLRDSIVVLRPLDGSNHKNYQIILKGDPFLHEKTYLPVYNCVFF